MNKDNGFNVNQVYRQEISLSSTFFQGSLTSISLPIKAARILFVDTSTRGFSHHAKKIPGVFMHKHEVLTPFYLLMHKLWRNKVLLRATLSIPDS